MKHFLCVFLLLLALAASACGVSSTPPADTATPDQMMTALVQTLTAIAAPTEIPPATSTPLPPTEIPVDTPVPFPTITPIPSFTPQPSFTPFGTPPAGALTPTPGDGGSGNADFACKIVEKSPDNWTTMKSRAAFDASWTVTNAGSKIWHFGGIMITYVDGAKFHQGDQKSFNLSDDVKPGEQTILLVDMIAPKAKGNHTATWGLMETKSKLVFCTFTVMITVK